MIGYEQRKRYAQNWVGEYRFATSSEESTRRTKMFPVKLVRSLLERYRTIKKKEKELDISLENFGFYKRKCC